MGSSTLERYFGFPNCDISVSFFQLCRVQGSAYPKNCSVHAINTQDRKDTVLDSVATSSCSQNGKDVKEQFKATPGKAHYLKT